LNVRKLIDVAGRFQESSIGGLTDFIRYVRDQQVLAERETEAAAESEEGDVVRIMTIHKAKGLQAPVVFVADMSRGLGSGTGLLAFHPEHGLAMKVRNPLSWEMEPSLTYAENAERMERKSFLEEKRLLYVAMTRAEEHLVLVGCSDLKVNHRNAYCNIKNWTGWLEKALAVSQDSEAGVINGEGFLADFKRGFPAVPGTAGSDSLPISARFTESLVNGKRLDIAESPDSARLADELLERYGRVEKAPVKMATRLSVSQALDYSECPARYHLLYDIGIPEEDMERDDIPVESGEYTSAADLGMEAHRILSELEFGHDLHPQIETLLERIANPVLKGELSPPLLNFAESSWARELAEAEAVVKERPFELKVGGTVLAGRMDVVFRGTDGWTVLDYKTGRAEDRDRYALQVGIYAYAASKLLGQMPPAAALVLLSLDDEWSMSTSDGILAQKAADTICRVSASVREGRFDPRPGKACAWCPSVDACSAKLSQ
jgi:ATP-dependent exoDNAse (exonuclease V) beta subunit